MSKKVIFFNTIFTNIVEQSEDPCEDPRLLGIVIYPVERSQAIYHKPYRPNSIQLSS